MNEENKEKLNEKRDNKKIVKKILIVLAILFAAFIFISLLPFIGFIVIVIVNMLDIPSKPNVEHGEFNFELVYEYKGEQTTISDTIICDYEGYSFALDAGNTRDWSCKFKNNEDGFYYIDIENEPYLYILVPYAAEYYMGDKNYTKDDSIPYISYYDEDTDTYYQETEKVEVVDVEIISWESSEPLKDNIK